MASKRSDGRRDRPVAHEPDEAASDIVVKVGFLAQFQIYRDLQFNMEFGKGLKTFNPFTGVIWIVWAALMTGAAYTVSEFGVTTPHVVVAGLLFALASFRGAIMFVVLSSLNAIMFASAWVFQLSPEWVGAAAFFPAAVAAWKIYYDGTWVLRRSFTKSQASEDRKEKWRVTGETASKIATSAEKTIKEQLPDTDIEKLSSLRSDVEDPYRIVRGAIRVDPDFFKAPDGFVALRKARKKAPKQEWTLARAQEAYKLVAAEKERYERVVDLADAF
ncbi:MAG: hypothetical protein AAGJ87_08955, partial [Pseudomonadota bacterium]